MKITTSPLPLTKRFPLTISRGTSAGSENLLVTVEHDGIAGYGEMAPFNIGYGEETAEGTKAQIETWAEALHDLAPWQMQRFEQITCTQHPTPNTQSPALCALDFALHDWLGKRTGIPVWKLLGGDISQIPPTSITVGINPPEIVRERISELMARLNPQILKIKLGSPAGIEADQEIFATVVHVLTTQRPNDPTTQRPVKLRVDANGGWTLEEARRMIAWLAERGCEYVEQPLPIGQEFDLSVLYGQSPIPIFADESCCTSKDLPKLAGRVHGINLKLMKAGGIREGLRVIHTARAHGLKVMMGCMSESSLAIAGSLALAPYADYLDLDSHLNLLPDPFEGLLWQNGRVLPSNSPGLGVGALLAAPDL